VEQAHETVRIVSFPQVSTLNEVIIALNDALARLDANAINEAPAGDRRSHMVAA